MASSSEESEQGLSDINSTPPELLNAAHLLDKDLLPAKSKEEYNNAYENFMKWRNDKKASSFSETVLLAYFGELAVKYKAGSLWAIYSMLKCTLKVNKCINIEQYFKLKTYLKRKSDGYIPKKSKILTGENVEKFINEAPEDTYLATKVNLFTIDAFNPKTRKKLSMSAHSKILQNFELVEKTIVIIINIDVSGNTFGDGTIKRVECARFGDVGCIMPVSYKKHADNFRNMAVRADDVWVATFPRSGTTWTQELVWLLMNDFDYGTASRIPLTDRYFLPVHIPDKDEQKKLDPVIREQLAKVPSFDSMVNAPSPRYMKTHMPFSLLPLNLLDTSKVVYVARDPRDVALSYYHLCKQLMNYKEDFKSYWNLFIKDLVTYCPFFPHLKEAWALRHHPNVLFIFYEEMKEDLPSCIKRIAEFLGKEVTNEQVMKLSEHLDIKQFKKNDSVNPSWLNPVKTDADGFVRKGVSGGWRAHFDEEMAAQAQHWLRVNLAGTDLRFPHANSNVEPLQ